MENNLSKLIKSIAEIVNDDTRSPENINDCLQILIKGHTSDVINLYKNVIETSYNEIDKKVRIESLCKLFGLSNSEIDNKFY